MYFCYLRYIILILAICFILVNMVSSEEIIWSNNGPYGGRIYALAVDPIDPAIVYAGTYGHGIFKSYNSGASWLQMSNGLPIWPDSTVGSPGIASWRYGDYFPMKHICINPLATNNLLVGIEGGGIYRSSNGGQEWFPSDIGLPSSAKITAIIQTPLDTSLVFAGLGYPTGGAYKSTDGGKSWSLIDNIPHGKTYSITTIAVHPDLQGIIYMGFTSAGEPGTWCGLWKSQDYGDNWEVLVDDLIPIALCIDPHNSHHVYAIFLTSFEEYLLFKSSDSGYSWELIMPQDSDGTINIALNKYSDPSVLFASTWDKFFMSSNHGSTWTDAFNGLVRDDYGFIDFDVNPLDPEVLYVGNATGLYRSEDGGATVDLNVEGMINTYINDVAVHPSDVNTVYAGGWTGGMWKSPDGGLNWNAINRGANYGEVNTIAIDPRYPDTLYRSGDGIYRSYDGGENWDRIGSGWVTTIAIRPDSTNIIFCAPYPSTVLKSTNRGQTWKTVFSASPYTLMINTINIDPLHPSKAYFAASGDWNMGLHKTIDGGESWEKISSPGHILSLAIDPVHPETMYVGTLSSGVKKSTDGGLTFYSINNGLLSQRVEDLVIDLNNQATLYAGTQDRGVFISTNFGDEWIELDGGIGDPRTWSLALPPLSSDIMYIGTQGSGVWKVQGLLTSVEPSQPVNFIPEGFGLKNAYPNPFNNSTTITYSIPVKTEASLKVINIRGQLVKCLKSSVHVPGQYQVQWNGTNETGVSVATGLYFVILQAGQFIKSQKVILLK